MSVTLFRVKSGSRSSADRYSWTHKNVSNNPFREQRSPNPFRGLPSDDSKPTNVANIRELITQLPSEEFDALFDELEEKDFH